MKIIHTEMEAGRVSLVKCVTHNVCAMLMMKRTLL